MLRAHHLVERREMRKGGRIPQCNKLWVVERGLKRLDSFPLCHINKAEPGVRRKAPVEPGRDVSGLPLHKGFGGFPLCQKYLVLAFGHFKGIDENHRWHRYAPSHPSMVRLDAEDSAQAHTESRCLPRRPSQSSPAFP